MLQNDKNNHAGYEKRDVNLLKVLLWTLLSAAFVVVCLIGLNDYFLVTTEEVVFEAVLKPQSSELRELQARDTQVLSNYGVVDASKGVYHIPIKRAMRLLAEEAFVAEMKQLQK